MDFTSRRHERGHPMSRYIAATLLAIAAAAVVSVTELAATVDQSDSAHPALMVQP